MDLSRPLRPLDADEVESLRNTLDLVEQARDRAIALHVAKALDLRQDVLALDDVASDLRGFLAGAQPVRHAAE